MFLLPPSIVPPSIIRFLRRFLRFLRRFFSCKGYQSHTLIFHHCLISFCSLYIYGSVLWFFSFVSNLSSKSLQACIFTWNKVKVASWTCGPCSSRRACSLPSGNGYQGGALILRGRATTVVEDRVPFVVESELFCGQVRCRPWRNASRDDHVSNVN